MTLIDQFLSEYQFSKSHRMAIAAPADTVYQAMLELDMSRSLLIKILFRLRGMPRSELTFRNLEHSKFSLLGEQPGRELLLGLAGQFWRLNGNTQKVDSQTFMDFNRAGFAKAVWNFYLEEFEDGISILSTETRIYCMDQESYRKFRNYWFFIRPFSGLIRRKMLQIIKAQAEKR